MRESAIRTSVRAPFELEVAGLDEFLRLLELKLKEPASLKESLPRRAVCVADMFDRHSTESGIARVKRYVRGSFAYHEDLISIELVSSHGYEHPDPEEVRKLEEKHTRLLEHVRATIQDSLVELDGALRFPLVRGFVHVATDPRSPAS